MTETTTDEHMVCGEDIDHDEETTFESEERWEGVCRRCGAELFWTAEDA